MIEKSLLLFGLTLALAACGSQPGGILPSPEAGAGSEPASVGGVYDVTGTTVDRASGVERPISGTIVLVQQGERYTAHFELDTLYPGSEVAARASVVGTGDGSVSGRTLRGSADTTLMQPHVPGVDVGFALIPRQVGARIVSRTSGWVDEAGALRVEIENQPAEGEAYAPTRTVLRGTRVASEDLAALPGDEP